MKNLKDDISLELVTNIAAKLLKGEDYTKAAIQALELISACEMERSVFFADGESQFLQEMRDTCLLEGPAKPPTKFVPWKKAVRLITGKRTETDALEAFRKAQTELSKRVFELATGKSDEDTCKAAANRVIANYKQKGVSVEELEDLKLQYRSLPRRGQRKIK